jgi:hypothetical protein
MWAIEDLAEIPEVHIGRLHSTRFPTPSENPIGWVVI